MKTFINLLGCVYSAENHLNHEEEEIDHVHTINPAWHGNCVGCVSTRRIYCLNGRDPTSFKQGTCMPRWDYCTEGG